MSEDKKKNVEILIKSVVLSQSKGAFSLKDASTLHQVIVSLLSETDKKIEEREAIGALVQGATIGQKAGAFTLDDAASVFDAIKWFDDNDTSKKLDTIPEEVEEKIKEI